VGTLAAIVGDVAQHFMLGTDELAKQLFGQTS
jgi:hypothetical protein